MYVTRQLDDVATDRVVSFPDTEVNALALMIAREHTELAAVVTRPTAAPVMPADFVHAVVDDLERVAVELLPAWLPDAAEVDRPDTIGLAATRMVATAHARRAHYPVPFLTELAVLALTGRRPTRTVLPLRTRTAALARLVAEAFGRRRVVLLVELAGATPGGREVVAAGADWLVQNGGPAVWLVGAGTAGPDRIPAVSLSPPPPTARPADDATIVGRPHPASTVEKALEVALAAESWAAGRRWNQSYQSNALSSPVRLDLLWPEERCVVELDGPEHCHPARFEADRQRDVLLQLDGYAVLRFTNTRVTHDVGAVVHQIGTYLRARRRDTAEGRDHGQR